MLLQMEHRRRLALTSRTAPASGFGIIFARTQNMERQPLRSLAADARQFFQFVDEPGHGFGEA